MADSSNPKSQPAQQPSASMVVAPQKSPEAFGSDIAAFHTPLSGFLTDLGLPTDKVLYPIPERQHVILNLNNALAVLPLPDRQKAVYLSRFTVAVCAGLFDGAINYLWNEAVAALRRLVTTVDLAYFFSVAAQVNNQYSKLSSEDDLPEVSEHDLLETCRRMGLLSDVNFSRLAHVNYMRNHASAAHPNDAEITGFEILGWLTNCLKHAITAEPDRSVIRIKQLLGNIRTKSIPAADFPVIGQEVEHLSPSQIDDLLTTMFGMYTDMRTGAQVKTNIEQLAPYVWKASSEDRKYVIGSRFGVLRKNGEVDRKAAAEDFLKAVGGLRFRDDDSLAADLLDGLQSLKSAHFGPNNFYSEWPHAKMLLNSLPASGEVPRAARPMWVKVICLCYIGNGHGYKQGVDETAVQYYSMYLKKFGEAEVSEFLHLFSDVEFVDAFERELADKRVRHLATGLKTRTTSIHQLRALDAIIQFPSRTLHKIHQDSTYRAVLANAPRHP